jgi:nicotinamidase/pyrazinamidase
MSDLNAVAREIEADRNIPKGLRASDPTAKRRRRILVVVDAQVDFVMRFGLLSIAGAEAIVVPGLGILASLDSDEYAAVIYTYDTHTAARYLGSQEHLGQPDKGIPGFRLHCEKGTPGWETVFNPRIVPAGIPVFELEKEVFDAFEKPSAETLVYQTNADRERLIGSGVPRDDFYAHLAEMGVDTATVIGVAADYCVKDKIRGLLARGFRVEVIVEATAGIGRDMIQTIEDEFPGLVDVVPASVPQAPPAPVAAND